MDFSIEKHKINLSKYQEVIELENKKTELERLLYKNESRLSSLQTNLKTMNEEY